MENKKTKLLIISGVALILIGIGLVSSQFNFYSKDKIKLNYRYIGNESEGYISISDGKNVGYISTNLEQVIGLKYPVLDNMKINDDVDLSNFKVKDGLFPYTSENKIGLVDKDENIVIDAKYDYINVISKDFIIVSDNGNYNIINSKGEIMFPSSFQDIATIEDVDNLYLAYNNNKVGLIDINNNFLLECNYDNVSVLVDDVSSNYLINATRDNNVELYLYSDGRLDLVNNFSNIDVMFFSNDDIYMADFEGKYSIYNIEAKSLKTLNNTYVAIEPYYNGIALAVNENGLIGYIDKDENIVIDYQYSYDKSTSFKNGMAVVGENDNVGVINKNDEKIIPFKYVDIDIIDDKSFIVLDKNNKMYIIDNKENKVSNVYDYINITDFKDIFLVSKTSNSKTLYGIINSNGKEIVPVKYEDIKISNNYFILKQNNEYSIEKR